MDAEKEFLTVEQLCERLGLEVSTFQRLVAKGILPQGMSVTGGKLKRWKKADIAGIAYMLEVQATRLRKSTPDEEERDFADL